MSPASGPGLPDADLREAVAVLRSVSAGPPPPPTAALAHLLDVGFEPEVVPLRRPAPRRRWAARAGAGLTAAAASLVLAGTAQALPAAVQDGLADLVGAVTPFEFPRSPASEPPRPPAPTDDPAPSSGPTPSAPAAGPVPDAPGADLPETAAEERTVVGRQERDRRPAAEEAAAESAAESADAAEDAAEDAADETADAAEDAAEDAARAEREAERAQEDAAREAARASEEAAEESADEAAEQAERDAEDAERED